MPEITTACFPKLHAGKYRYLNDYIILKKRAVSLPVLPIPFFQRLRAGKK
ncbi:hypothetical protein [Ignatzschineria cameli]|nr:hypothetical protein [Ignatzschineria cameli]